MAASLRSSVKSSPNSWKASLKRGLTVTVVTPAEKAARNRLAWASEASASTSSPTAKAYKGSQLSARSKEPGALQPQGHIGNNHPYGDTEHELP
jgi:hypothetical protein